MDPRKLTLDQRLTSGCVYCGGTPDTVDHVPSKVFLDEPYPDDLPVVRACAPCNNGFSRDEAYLACLVECALAGSLESAAESRPVVARRLTAHPGLAALLRSARSSSPSGTPSWVFDPPRVRNVLLKLARGHLAYELGEPQLEPPKAVSFLPVQSLSAHQRSVFEAVPPETLFPEIGSRAFLGAVLVGSTLYHDGGWRVVQASNYRYLVSYSSQYVARFVIREYLACEVLW